MAIPYPGGGNGDNNGGGGGTTDPVDPNAPRGVLDVLTYDEPTHTLVTDATVQSGLNSFTLGGAHRMHAAGENVYFENEITGVNYVPTWQPLVPSGAYTDQNGVSKQLLGGAMRTKLYAPLSDISRISEGTLGSVTLPFSLTVTPTVNEYVSGVSFVVHNPPDTPADPQDPASVPTSNGGHFNPGRLVYTIKDFASDIPTYQQVVNYPDGLPVDGSTIAVTFTHGVETAAGTKIGVDITYELEKDDRGTGLPVLCYSYTEDPLEPYRVVSASTWTYVDVTHGFYDVATTKQALTDPQNQNSPTEFDYLELIGSATYRVDTTLNRARILVPEDTPYSFTVQSHNDSFTVTNPCVIEFLQTAPDPSITATLQNIRDDYTFWKISGVWWYKNNNTGESGVV